MYCGSLVHWHWKASIISHLSVVVPSIPFNSLGELLNSPYQVTTLANSAYQDIFEGAQDGVFKNIWDTKFQNKDKSLKATPEEQIAVIRANADYAMYDGYSTLENTDDWKNCAVTDTKFIVNSADNAFAFPKDSPFKDLFDLALQKMVESGELERIRKSYSVRKPDCGGGKGRKLGFGTTCFAMAVFVIGLGFCCASLLLEKIRKMFKPMSD